MRLFISMAAALGLCICALVACSPQDGSAPPAAAGSSNARNVNSNTTAANGGATAAAQTTKSSSAPQGEETRRISIAETQAAIAAGNVLLVDVRDENTYKTSHIKGAKSVPLPQVEKRAAELPKDKLIITYCA